MKNLTDFRKTVETGVDPRLTISTTNQVNLFLNSIYARQRWVSTKLLKKGNIFSKCLSLGSAQGLYATCFLLFIFIFTQKDLTIKACGLC